MPEKRYDSRDAIAPDIVTLHVPFRVVKRGGRKEMQLPEGAPQQRKIDNTLVKALARAFRWKKMLETGISLRSLSWPITKALQSPTSRGCFG